MAEDDQNDEFGPSNSKTTRITSAKIWGNAPVTNDEVIAMLEEKEGTPTLLFNLMQTTMKK